MEVKELQEKIREVYKLINYQNNDFEWNDKLREARKILNDIQSKLHQPTVISAVCDCQKRTGGYCAVCLSSTENCKCTFIPQTDL